ncbi:hypothetical protein [Kribbella sp. NPDC006257]|uniref:hypothetical protein n=1 Tax=Kribbella sp. NPDC006257 TaxID=3156738 RepID=UPI0033BC2E4B
MSDQSNQSDYDRRVKDILDRVAKGHLSSDEAATLIAAATPTPRHATPPATDQSETGTPTTAPGDPDTPTTGDSGTPSATTDPAAPADPADPGDPADTPSAAVWAEVVDSPETAVTPPSAPSAPAEPTAPSAPAEPTAPSAPVSEERVQDSVVDDAPVEAESQHSDLVVPPGVRRVTVRAIGRRVRLIGEPAVTGVAVDGPHVIKRDGDTLAISSEGDMGVSIDGLSMLRNPTDLKSHVNGLAKELSIRVNPMLQVEIEVTGGSVTAERLPGLSRVRVTAGTAKVTDVDGPIDMLVQAGTATLDAQITKGRSRVRVESGAANVTLRRGSDVRVHTEAQLGRVSWTGAVSGQSKDVEIGRGRAALDVEVLVGSAQITSD